MAKNTISNIKLGAFVIAGVLFLVLLLFMIGKNRSLFGNTYVLKARFENIQGLVAGNNIRYSGIQTGTVKNIKIINDTVIEVTMLINKKMLGVIRKNAIVSIGTEGFVGNKVVNIVPAKKAAPFAEEGDVLSSKKALDTDEMLQTLSKTNNDVAAISSGLKTTVLRINNSSALWALLDDKSLPKDLKISIGNIKMATTKAARMAANLDAIVDDVKEGKGSAGAILKDTSFATNLNDAVLKIKSAGNKADSIAAQINEVVTQIRNDMNNGKGTINALFKDTAMVIKLNTSLDNIQKGTDGFNQNMEALKHNFLLRGYFKKLERKKAKDQK